MILVTGDLVLDHNIYAGGRLAPDARFGNGTRYGETPGGCMLTYGLLEVLVPGGVRFGFAQTTSDQLRSWPKQFHTWALWGTVPNSDKPKDGKHWALERYLGYGEPEKQANAPEKKYPGDPAPDLEGVQPKILVLDDGGLGFREAQDCWPEGLKRDKRPDEVEWVILKMSRPLASGDLWLRLTSDSWRERLIVVVSADQLRREGLHVAGGLSWETSVDDIVGELKSNRAVSGLRQGRHLIVTMRSDAALWLDQAGGSAPGHCQLVFDRNRSEGEWEEQRRDWNAYGFHSMVTASVAWSLLQSLQNKKDGIDRAPTDQVDFTVALAAGLSGTRFLRKHGHGSAEVMTGFPFAGAAAHLKSEAHRHGKKPEFVYASAEVPCEPRHPLGTGRAPATSASGGGRNDEDSPPSPEWTILSSVSPWHTQHDKVSYGPARRVALLGPDKLPGVPCARFEKLETLDRHEIDSLRSLRQLMLMYRDGGARKQPLCLAVFGAPGAGKSFGLKQIAAGVFGEKTPILEFNLSQFNGTGDLIGAFHQVRDKVLSGATPVVFWDEFDSENLKWLQYFLAPMQDGAFQEGQVTHFVGKSVFVFAGGTSYTFKQFSSPRNPKDEDQFKFKKGPDFVSRLGGYLDIAGPNPREGSAGFPVDREFPVRRALVIRTTLGLGDRPLEIERGLLTALLAARRYCNGARSLDRLVTYIRDRGGMPLRRAYLPPDEVLALYVEDVPEFHELTRKYADFYAQADLLAPVIHADYLGGLSAEDRQTKPNAKAWDDLRSDIKDSNVAAALRIPEILELAGLALEEGSDTSLEVLGILDNQIEQMAEAEHGGWEEQKRIDGWTYSQYRVEAALRHDLLIPYERLTDKIKEYDRNTIRNYPKYARQAGFKIVSLPKAPTSS